MGWRLFVTYHRVGEFGLPGIVVPWYFWTVGGPAYTARGGEDRVKRCASENSKFWVGFCGVVVLIATVAVVCDSNGRTDGRCEQ